MHKHCVSIYECLVFLTICVCLFRCYASMLCVHLWMPCISNNMCVFVQVLCLHVVCLYMSMPCVSNNMCVFVQVLCQHLLTLTNDIHGRPLAAPPKKIIKYAQLLAVDLIQENVIRHYEILSLDILGNALGILTDMGAMHRDKRWAWKKTKENVRKLCSFPLST